jgi:5'(3')-deoxyribonucleotidase
MSYCLLDLDGILVDFYQGTKDLLQLPDSWNLPPGEWDVCKVLNQSLEEITKNMDEKFWANLSWMPDGREILKMVENHFGQDNVILWTSPLDREGCMEGKRKWIQKHLPSCYHTHHRTIMGGVKWLGGHTDTVLIDDFDHNVTPFRKRGGRAILYPRLWNTNHMYRNHGLEFLQSLFSGRK